MSSVIPGIPDPGLSNESLRETAVMTKQAIEILAGQRVVKNKANAAVTWNDLVNLGLITPLQIPLKS